MYQSGPFRRRKQAAGKLKNGPVGAGGTWSGDQSA
jgi:hypothetical protein